MPLGFAIAVVYPAAWVAAFAGISGLLTAILCDAFLTKSARRIDVETKAAPIFFVGEDNEFEIKVTHASGGLPAGTRIQLDFTVSLFQKIPDRLPPSGG